MKANKHDSEEGLWAYNCLDCTYTREVGEVELAAVDSMRLEEVHAFQQALFEPVLMAMLRGVRIDLAARKELIFELQEELSKREAFFETVLGHSLNPRSALQMKKLFYNDLQQREIKTRAKKGKPGHVTLNDDALDTIAKREPILKPLIDGIREYRSLGVFLSTFAMAALDSDGRMRCSYNICGTETYRFSSSENAFGSGTNLQNLPKGDESGLFPNIRKLFIPDPGYTFFDGDLERADLYVVVYEAEDEELKSIMRENADIHAENAKVLGISRQLAKSWVHGTNYGGSPRTMAIACGITIKQAEYMRNRWFQAHPGILQWHERTMQSLRTTKSVANKFGYRRHYFDRIDNLLPEALAWIPQSTVACYINRVWLRIYQNIKEVHVLLQVHDSLAGQLPTHKRDVCKDKILAEARKVIVPYDDPLIIPFNLKLSDTSWGDCE